MQAAHLSVWAATDRPAPKPGDGEAHGRLLGARST